MKSKFIIVDRNGNLKEADQYRESSDCSADMAICIDREVLNIPPIIDSEKPAYLANAKKLGFGWEENCPIGFLQYDWKANIILRLVKEYARMLVNSIDMPIYEVSGSNFFDLKHPVVQSYAALFGDRLFRFNSEDDQLVMSYDASYPQFNLAGKYRFNEKHLPFAHFSISDCYRYEQSGECMILFRGRRFNMPDIHPYFKDVDQAWEWYPNIEKQLLNGFDLANRQFVNVAKVSSMKNWELYQDKIIDIAVKGAREVLVEIKLGDEERYWIVDIDYSFVDKLEQVREIGCIQIDVGNASRLGISYQGSAGESQNPVIIHSAIPGGIERYIYMLLDDMDRFPIYFQPIQLRLILVNEEFREYAQNIINAFPQIRIDIDDRAESVGKKIKDAHKELIPNYLVIGEKEMAEGEIPNSVKAVVEDIEDGCKGLPNIQCSIHRYLSKRIHI